MGVVAKGLGASNPTNKLANWVEILGQLISRKHVFIIFNNVPKRYPPDNNILLPHFVYL